MYRIVLHDSISYFVLRVFLLVIESISSPS